MKQLLEAREQELRPGQAIEDKSRSALRTRGADHFEYAYNAQISVGKSQVIRQQANDAQEVVQPWMRWRRRAVGCR